MTTAEPALPQPDPEPIEIQDIVIDVNPDPMTSQIIERGDEVADWETR